MWRRYRSQSETRVPSPHMDRLRRPSSRAEAGVPPTTVSIKADGRSVHKDPCSDHLEELLRTAARGSPGPALGCRGLRPRNHQRREDLDRGPWAASRGTGQERSGGTYARSSGSRARIPQATPSRPKPSKARPRSRLAGSRLGDRPGGWQLDEPQQLLQGLEPVRPEERVGNVKFHGLRHRFATLALASGIEDAVTVRLLGHSSTKILQRYQAVVPSLMVQAASRMTSVLGG